MDVDGDLLSHCWAGTAVPPLHRADWSLVAGRGVVTDPRGGWQGAAETFLETGGLLMVSSKMGGTAFCGSFHGEHDDI